jgi:error-prone DNA polymerase
MRDGRRVKVGGVVLVRQRPSSSKGVVFLTLEDETGIANIVVWPKLFEAFRAQVMGARMMLIEGRVQRAADSQGAVIHVVAEKIHDRTADLGLLSCADAPLDPPTGADAAKGSGGETRRHPRDARVLPPSRDFH